MSALSDALNAANVNGWSSREIARRTGDRLNHATVANYLRGKHAARPTDEALTALAEAFPSLTVQKLRELAGLGRGEEEPYQPPAEANQLDARQRRVIDELIRLLAATKERDGDVRDAASMNAGAEVRQLTRREEMQQVQKKAARKEPK